MANRAVNAIKQIKMRDVVAPFIFLLLLIPSWVFRIINKLKHRKLWLVAEQGEARDNGYHFYKYIREKHPEDYCFYAINTDSAGYKKVVKLGNIIKWGSLKHWLYYMSANLNISSQKSGNPCPIFWYFIHVTLGLYRNRAFLQHGVIMNELTWLYYSKTKFKYFVTSAQKEYEEIKKNYGYVPKSIILTGLPRWDNLSLSHFDKKTILIMPTWRKYLGISNNSLFSGNDFQNSDYFKKWNELIGSADFIKLVEDNDINVYFYPHQNIQNKIDLFMSRSKNIKILSLNEDISKYMSKCDLMITDYSSAMFDFAYLGKPVIYYQFDQEEYRKNQYEEGYFSYEKDGFGEVVIEKKDLIKVVKSYVLNGYEVKYKYKKRINTFFTLRDKNNSERVYGAINHKNKKIMQVVYGMNVGGIESFVMNLYRNINRDRYEFVFLTNKPGKYDYQEEIEKLGGRFVKIDAPRAGNRLRHLIQVNRVLKKEKPDVVHCHTYFDAATVMLAAKHNRIKKRITHSHTTEGNGLKRNVLHKILAFIIRNASTDLVACSEEAGVALYKKSSFNIVSNGIEVQRFLFNASDRNKYRKEFGFSDDDIVIGHVGRLVEVKNHKYLLKIMKELKDEKYKMVFVGDGELKSYLKDEARKNNIEDRVLFLGNRSDTSGIYNAFDIFVFPSMYEGLGMALVEAQANGLPIVASSAVPANVKMNPNFTFKDIAESPQAWKNTILAINRVRVDPSKKVQEYSIGNTVRQLVNIYDRKDS